MQNMLGFHTFTPNFPQETLFRALKKPLPVLPIEAIISLKGAVSLGFYARLSELHRYVYYYTTMLIW